MQHTLNSGCARLQMTKVKLAPSLWSPKIPTIDSNVRVARMSWTIAGTERRCPGSGGSPSVIDDRDRNAVVG
ncbi:hypothetical protein L226DRAFT_71389 [Lentinus tigrinus ALCF2SS1-7]|uniref:uncharacterized protein n=1 Tax=Lentinus tigrinus ALCF2SS1-7 TaxID=1328758 RepID=UPI0011660645|nr:hypothetical protein L226DRAFT_71389 [Lentinus tigrinus ALCF2SS1-7]